MSFSTTHQIYPTHVGQSREGERDEGGEGGVVGEARLAARWCSGYHVCFTRRRSPVRTRVESPLHLPPPHFRAPLAPSSQLWSTLSSTLIMTAAPACDASVKCTGVAEFAVVVVNVGDAFGQLCSCAKCIATATNSANETVKGVCVTKETKGAEREGVDWSRVDRVE